jgi:4-amino-4-deoxy-L-arabinose transferase-like glycosyltransferase
MLDRITIRPQLMWSVVLAMALIAVVPRLLFINVPFERDEGAYAYVSEIIDDGGLPYRDAFDHKPPGIYYLYNLSFKLFGHGVHAPRIMAALFTLAGCVLCWILVFRITASAVAGTFAIAFFGLATFSPVYQELNANTEVFTIPLLIGGINVLLDGEASALRGFFYGVLFGLALFIKQSVAPVVLAAFLYRTASNCTRLKPCIGEACCCASGVSLPVLLCTTYFYAHGALEAFWTGFLRYNAGYIGGPTMPQAVEFFMHSSTLILRGDPLPWLAGLGGIGLFLTTSARTRHKWLVVSLLAGAGISVALGRYFYRHYFIILIPFVSIGIGLGIARASTGRWKVAALTAASIALAGEAGMQARYCAMSSDSILQTTYGNQPFAQSVVIARYLRQQGACRTAYIIGSEPQILFYAGLRSPTRFFYFYPLILETPLRDAFRKEALGELRRAMPDVLIYVNNPVSHYIPAQANDPFLLSLFRLFSGYRLVGLSVFGQNSILTDEASLQKKDLLTRVGSIHIYCSADYADQTRRRTLGTLFGL